MKKVILLFIVTLCLFIPETKSQNLSGREFWFAFPRVSATAPGEGASFFIISDYCIDSGLVEIPQLGYKQYFNIVPGQYTQITLPATINGLPYYHNLSGAKEKKGIRVATPFPVAVYGLTYVSLSVDGETVIPSNMLGTEYVAAIRGGTVGGTVANPSLVRTTIIGTETNTSVTIYHWNSANGNPITTNIILGRGETYQVSTNRNVCGAEMNSYPNCAAMDGVRIVSDKNIAVVSSIDCASTNECGACDNLMTMPLPVEKWGKEFAIAQVIPRQNPALGASCLPENTNSGDWFQIIGAVGTKVTISNLAGTRVDTIKTLTWDRNANYGYGSIFGQNPVGTGFGNTNFGNCDMVINADKPIQVLQYSKGWQTDNQAFADPEAVYTYPTDYWNSSYLIGALRATTSTTGNLLVILNDVGNPLPSTTIVRNGANIGAGGWVQIGNTTWKYKRIAVIPSNATNRFESTGGHKFSVYSSSSGQAESFTFQGGIGPILKETCPTCAIPELSGKTAFCIGENIQFTDLSRDNDPSGLSNIVSWEWIWGDGTSDTYTTKTNPTHTYTTAGNYTITLRVTNNSTPICTQDFEYKVYVSDGPALNLGPNATICKGDSIKLGGNPTVSGGLAPYVMAWSQGASLSSTTAANPIAKPISTTSYELSVTDAANCNLKKTVTITVNPVDSASLSLPATICAGTSHKIQINITPYNPSLTYNLVYTDGTSATTLSNVKNGDFITVSPITTTEYSISNFESSNACDAFSTAKIKVTVRPIPTADFTSAGPATICLGSSYQLKLNLSGDKPYNYEITNDGGLPTITRNNYNGVVPASETVVPTKNTVFTITKVEYPTAPNCAVTLNKTFTVNTQSRPNPSTGNTATICEKNNIVLTTLLNTPVDGGGFWSDSTSSGGLNVDTFQPQVNKPGTFIFKYNLSGNNICPDTFSVAKVTVVAAPKFGLFTYNCDADGKNYVASAVLSGGDPTSYVGTGGLISFQGNKYVFNSNSFANKSSQTVSVDDANNCGPSNEIIRFNCACKTNAGTMIKTPIEICETGTAMAVFNNDAVLNPSDSLIFILHEGNDKSIVKEIARNDSAIFNFDPSKMQYGQTYYISPVAGAKSIDGVDTNIITNECLSIGAGQPIRFFQQIDAQLLSNIDICQNATGSLTVNLLSGQNPFDLRLNEVGTNNDILFSALNTPASLSVNPSSTTSYRIKEVSDKYCTNSNPNQTTIIVTVHDTPRAIAQSKLAICNSTGTQYTYSFDLSGGDAASYAFAPANVGSIGANGITFTFNPVNSGAQALVVISDKYNCGSTQVDTIIKCNCITTGGTITGTPKITVCENNNASFASVSGNNQDGDDIVEYILSSSKLAPLSSILERSKTPSFTFKPSYTPGISYYAFAITGNNNNNQVDINDPCLGISNAIEIVFISLPIATLGVNQTICNNQNTNLVVQGFANPGMNPQFPYTIEYSANAINQAIPPAFNSLSGSIPISPNTTTNYKLLKVTDANGCFSNFAAQNIVSTVTVSPAPSANISIDKTAICDGDRVTITINFSGNKPYNYKLNTGLSSITRNGIMTANDTMSFIPSSNTNYQLIDLNDGCPGLNSNSVGVIVNPNPTANISTPAQVCEGVPVEANLSFDNPNATYNITYLENTAVKYLGNKKTGDKFPVQVSIGNNNFVISQVTNNLTGCVSNNQGIANTMVTALPVAMVLSANNTICQNTEFDIEIELNGNGPFNFQVFENGNFLSSESFGSGKQKIKVNPQVVGTNNYTFDQLRDANNCTNTFPGNLSLEVITAPTVNFTPSNNQACVPVAAIFENNSTPIGDNTCVWNFGDGKTEQNCGTTSHIYQNPGNYDVSLTVTSNFGCVSTLSLSNVVNAYAIPKADFNFSNTNLSVVDPNVTLLNQSSLADHYLWKIEGVGEYTAENPFVIFPDSAEQNYLVKLIATSDEGCVDSTSKLIRVDGIILVHIPNGFTPNGDGINDTFIPILNGERSDIKFYQFNIFNRWGQLLFTTTDPNTGWDGKYNGQKVQVDTYSYSVKVKSRFDAEARLIIGDINIVD